MQKNTTFEGVYNLGKNGIAYITNRENGEVIEIPAHLHNTALHKDLVEVRVTDPAKKEGEITQIIKRAQEGFVGTLKKKGEHFALDADNFKIPEITLPVNPFNTKIGERVFVTIERYEPVLVGKIEKHLGKAESNDAHMNGIALEQGFDFTFPEDVQKEADAIEARGITDADRAGRRDMRHVLTFTIDPADAKDFDDALSFQKLDNGNYEIGIHIADVSHYVTPGSALDREAQKRTTSVYLVDRTIPMLPEELSNGLCSLNQDEEKLAFSTVFEINPETGVVVNEWFGRTLIQSNKRFTYEEAQDIIDAQSGIYAEELLEFNRLAKIYEQQRHDNGSLNFETYEVKFVLDEKGVPISVKVKDRIDTNKLIEEFMLLANNRVALYMKDAPFFVYRIHGKPELERMEKLHDFLKLLGYETEIVDGIIPVKKLQQIIAEAEGKPIYETLQTVIVRSMQKAIYTTHNIGHFGLAFGHYSHFTSPIRRYPDVLAHRLLEHKLTETQSEHDQDWFEKMCDHSSIQEQKAVTAERNSIKLKQVEYMKNKDQNAVFKGIVTGAGKFGVFVAELESRSEGMVRISDLGNDFWEYQENTGVMFGKQSKKIFKIGDTIDIAIKRVDLEKRLIDYYLVEDGKVIKGAPPRHYNRKNPRQKSSEKDTKRNFHKKNK